MSADADWLSIFEGRIRFEVRLTPTAGANGFCGLAQDAAGRVHLKARVTAVAEKNKANQALVALIAKSVRVAKSDVRIAAGGTSRMKTIEIAGLAGALEPVVDRLRALAE